MAYPVEGRPQNFYIEQDDLSLICCSAIPLFGIIAQLMISPPLEQQLDRALNRDNDRFKAIRLIEIKSEYSFAFAFRDVSTCLLAGIMISTANIIANLVVTLLIIYTTLRFLHCFGKLFYNEAVISEIRQAGIRPGLTVR